MKVIAKQTAELEQLRSRISNSPSILSIAKESEDSRKILEDLEKRNQETSASLAQKEAILENKEKEIQELLKRVDGLQTSNDENVSLEKKTENSIELELAEKEKMLSEKEKQLKELQLQWQTERAELTKPALEQVTRQLEELKETASDSFILFFF